MDIQTLNQEAATVGVFQVADRLFSILTPNATRHAVDTLLLTCDCPEPGFCSHLWAAIQYEQAGQDRVCVLSEKPANIPIPGTPYAILTEQSPDKAARLRRYYRDIALKLTNQTLIW